MEKWLSRRLELRVGKKGLGYSLQKGQGSSYGKGYRLHYTDPYYRYIKER